MGKPRLRDDDVSAMSASRREGAEGEISKGVVTVMGEAGGSGKGKVSAVGEKREGGSSESKRS